MTRNMQNDGVLSLLQNDFLQEEHEGDGEVPQVGNLFLLQYRDIFEVALRSGFRYWNTSYIPYPKRWI